MQAFYRLAFGIYLVCLIPMMGIVLFSRSVDWLAVAAQPVTHNMHWRPYVRDFREGIALALVPAGCFDMGEAGQGGRQCFDEPFWISRFEITQDQYQRCVVAFACQPNEEYSSWVAYTDEQPATGVTWYQALDFAEWFGCSLPSEAQWEYVARGPDDLLYPWGNQLDTARYHPDTYIPTLVGRYSPQGDSWVGAADMAGNAGEWTASTIGPYPYDAQDGREDLTDRAAQRMTRGGGRVGGILADATVRAHALPRAYALSVGFRVACPFYVGMEGGYIVASR